MTFVPDRDIPALILPARYTRNGQAPNGIYVKQCARATNHISTFRKKHIWSYARNFDELPASSASARTFGNTYFVTGYNTARIEIMMGMIWSDTIIGNMRAKATITKVSDSSTQTIYFNAPFGVFTGAEFDDTIEKVSWVRKSVPVSAGSVYTVEIKEENRSRAVAGCIWELGKTPNDTADTAVVSQLFGATGSEILDADQQDITEAQTQLWKLNGSQLAFWSTDTSLVSSSSTSWTNLPLGGTASVGSATAGFEFDLSSYPCLSSTTVPVRIAAYAQRTSGSGTVGNNKIRFINSNGDYVQLTGINNTKQWWTADGTLPKGSGVDKWDLQIQTSGDTVAVIGAVLLCYES
jgi:hypothetical protein